jgi:hypothetical protein
MHRSSFLKTAGVLAAASALMVPLGCDAGSEESKQPTTPGAIDSGGADAKSTDRAPAIYAAVVRQLVTKDHTFGGADPGFDVVYVLDGVVEDAADPSKRATAHDPEEPFSHDVRDGVRMLSTLADLPPVEFVAERHSVVAGTRGGSSPGHVKNGGVLISLGPIEPKGKRVNVEASLWINGLAGEWLTYVLEERDGTWKVTGTTGPMAIS